MKIDIIIPTFNGLELLKKHLPSVLKFSPNINKIILVDDGGSDETATYASELSPKIVVIKNTENVGFPKSVNRGVAESEADFIVLLNNDVEPEKDYIENSLAFFNSPDVFAVTFNEVNTNYPVVFWHDGKFQYQQAMDKSRPHLSAWASGGSAIFRRSIWQALNGFNENFSPGYWEDIDLGWRAWKSGYRIIWNPTSKVEHLHQSTFNKLSASYINLIKQRNELLFIWHDITDLSLRFSHLIFLKLYTLSHPGYLKVIVAALLKTFKFKTTSKFKLTDQQVFNKISADNV